MKKILIIGIKGMAGHVIYNYLNKNTDYSVFGIARNIVENNQEISLDVSDTDKLKEIITYHNFDAVINCIGILNKDAEDNPAKAIWFNSYFPHFLEEITKESQTQVIHISTDCVFNGKKEIMLRMILKMVMGFMPNLKPWEKLPMIKILLYVPHNRTRT